MGSIADEVFPVKGREGFDADEAARIVQAESGIAGQGAAAAADIMGDQGFGAGFGILGSAECLIQSVPVRRQGPAGVPGL